MTPRSATRSCIPSSRCGRTTQKLFGEVLTNRTPVSWDFTGITGTSNDIARMVTVRAVINKNNTLG